MGTTDALKPLTIKRAKDVFAKQGWQYDLSLIHI